MKKIVFDIETKNTFQEVGSRNPQDLDISVLVIYDYDTDKYISYTEDELNDLWKIIEVTDLLVGYNSDNFDIPLLDKYYPGDLTKIKSVDLFQEVKKSIGRGVSLDMVAEGTLGLSKIGGGLDAVAWWKQGEIEKIKKYCQKDVEITKRIYEYALHNEKLKYKLLGEETEFEIDINEWEVAESRSVNYTLPF